MALVSDNNPYPYYKVYEKAITADACVPSFLVRMGAGTQRRSSTFPPRRSRGGHSQTCQVSTTVIPLRYRVTSDFCCCCFFGITDNFSVIKECPSMVCHQRVSKYGVEIRFLSGFAMSRFIHLGLYLSCFVWSSLSWSRLIQYGSPPSWPHLSPPPHPPPPAFFSFVLSSASVACPVYICLGRSIFLSSFLASARLCSSCVVSSYFV